MEKRALILAAALALPLALYGVPYAYALTSSSYSVLSDSAAPPNAFGSATIACTNPGDYVTGGGYQTDGSIGPGEVYVYGSRPNLPAGGPNPSVWELHWYNFDTTRTNGVEGFAICQSPVTVAGIGVPEFGSLYVAIALGAVVYFMLARRLAGRPTISTQS
jgi:hypothetical protein